MREEEGTLEKNVEGVREGGRLSEWPLLWGKREEKGRWECLGSWGRLSRTVWYPQSKAVHQRMGRSQCPCHAHWCNNGGQPSRWVFGHGRVPRDPRAVLSRLPPPPHALARPRVALNLSCYLNSKITTRSVDLNSLTLAASWTLAYLPGGPQRLFFLNLVLFLGRDLFGRFVAWLN